MRAPNRDVGVAACPGEQVADVGHAVEVIEAAVADGVAFIRGLEDPSEWPLNRPGVYPAAVARRFDHAGNPVTGDPLAIAGSAAINVA